MSFSTEVKNELCRVPMQRPCCTRAEAYGALLHATVFSHREIRLSTANSRIAHRLRALLQRAFSVEGEPQRQGGKYQLTLTDDTQIGRIFDVLGYDRKSHVTYHLNRNELDEDCCLAAFLRGAFLMAGTVAGPDKKSHLELKSGHQSLAGEEMSLLLDLGLSPKRASRAGGSLLYFKDGASVEDLLTRIGAPHAAMALMEAKVQKNVRNTINRRVNCETANFVKTADAAARQVVAIRRVLDARGMDAFPEAMRETVRLRLAHPTDTLAELAQRFDPPISKPGLSHRLKRITEFASKED